MSPVSHNFGFLEAFEAALLDDAVHGERCFVDLEAHDLAVAAYRRFAERLTEVALVRLGEPGQLFGETLRERMDRLVQCGGIPGHVREGSPRPAGAGVRITTRHRLKGLEFSCVILAAVRRGVVPLVVAADGELDGAARAGREVGERALLDVAATRARDERVLSAGGSTSPWLADA